MIFGMISLRFDSAVLQNTELEVENKVYLTAFSLADDLLEEIKQKAFDEQTVQFKAISTSALTSTETLGKESEVWPAFDDIDDYNGFSKPVSLPHAEKYTVSSNVFYVSPDDQDELSATQTYFKRVEIIVDSPYLPHRVKVYYIFTLHSK